MNNQEIPTAQAIGLVKTHLDIWSMTDSSKRLELATEVYAEHIQVIDPGAVIYGRQAVSDFIGDLQSQHPGFTFSMVRPAEVHHNSAILSWKFGPASQPEAITGDDIFTFENGKISTLRVFINGFTK